MRLDKDQWLLRLAEVASLRGTCARRKVGCVLADKDGHILSLGYNGPASGLPHCTDQPCAGVDQPSGHGLDLCEAIHAEQNALLQCHDVKEIVTAYTTVSPCVTCVKLLMNTSCQRIVFGEEYAHSSSRELWVSMGRLWTPL